MTTRGMRPSDRELDVLRELVSESEPTHGAIAVRLGLREETVKSYTKRLREKAGVSTKVGLFRWALRTGLIEPPEVDTELRERESWRGSVQPRDPEGLTPRERQVVDTVNELRRVHGDRGWAEPASWRLDVSRETVYGYVTKLRARGVSV